MEEQLGLERIKKLSAEVKDKAVLKIINYLLSRKDMNEKYLNEEKSLTQMIEFIKAKAKEKATNGVAMIEDDEVYSWAIHYFDESNKDLKISKTKSDVEVKEEKKSTVKKNKNWIPEGQLSLFD
ncbi:MAG TPA: hypothetical protein IAB59_07140 [Candidatus Onthousia faecipullorum]|uniref:PcfK-like protein n=1 Tax=Candidatus Onthousia faecipullorum TaxID=2840887 RepID=A0A9D1KCI8_9FIRM|nr:hypothetical protein [Candidatus Onthousia faecipullorum]